MTKSPERREGTCDKPDGDIRDEALAKGCRPRPSAALTDKQAEVLAFIKANMKWRGPTVRELARHFGTSINGVVCHLESLERKGRIRREPGESRNIQLVEDRE